ncbi:homeobox expressed in ES cells 1 [Chanos chanos]|uniref:Homeobox expressed in ES cells 1 n=1 Tax=Chanos chanos TaxID=29144 RepID=A0A6J2VTJ8_CHACN|nr:homeobox expressed in ES cells 1 [Chanos chanos]
MASLCVGGHENRPVVLRSVFTIDRILGLDGPDQRTVFSKLFRPWTDSDSAQNQNRFMSASNDNTGEKKVSQENQKYSKPPSETYRRALNWYIGRRPRTAFSSVQIEILENVFQINCYPGIDVREQLAQRLHIDEDRIQIWFQNRRAKQKRSHRESQFLLVKKVFTDLQERKEQ